MARPAYLGAMSNAAPHCTKPPRGNAGFGLIDALVALALLAVTLLGACGGLLFALRATQAAAWQMRAVDLVADLDEQLQQADPAEPVAARLESWRARVRQVLPTAEVAGLEPRSLVVGPGFTIGPGVYVPGELGIRTEVSAFLGKDGIEVTTPGQAALDVLLQD